MNPSEFLQVAARHHQNGRLADAEALYRKILAADPNQSDALHLLGLIAEQCGKSDTAIELIGQSIRINPSFAPAHYNLGDAYTSKRRFDAAADSYRQAIRLDPNLVEAYCNLAAALK